MNWKKTSDYSISDGRFHIAKFFVMGKESYTLWDQQKIIGHWPTSKEAKDEAAAIRNKDSLPAPESLV